MKHLLFALVCLIAFPVIAQESDTDYTMYQTILLSAKDGQRADLVAGIDEHNEMYHEEGHERVNVWNIMSGPRMGKMLWIKGPLTWTNLDTEHPKADHMDHWWGSVTPHANMEGMEFWRQWSGLSYMPEGMSPGVMVVRFFKVKQQKWNNVAHSWKPIIKLYSENNYNMGLQVFRHATNTGDGRDIAVIWYHENFASMDMDRNFWDSYEESYGMDRREYFEGWNSIAEFQGMEIMQLNQELSAPPSD